MRNSTYKYRRFLRMLAVLLCCLFVAGSLHAQEQLMDMDLEELMDLEVYSVSKKSQKLTKAPSAVFVITAEDIRRSGATTVPELLRMVPGMEVARINANTWSITARGFNGRFANKLLVLIDGRSVYTPAFSGVFWQEQELFLEDIARIEVIRGPGAALWGANAVNGVINITSKKSQDTQGSLIYGGGGSEERAMGGVRHGTSIGENGHVRLYAKYYNRDSYENSDGSEGFDQYDGFVTGFRSDFEVAEDSEVTFQGDFYSGQNEAQVPVPSVITGMDQIQTEDDYLGFNFLGRASHKLSSDSEIQAQLYFDRVDRELGIAGGAINTFDFELQHRFAPFTGNSLTWGTRVRHQEDSFDATEFVDFQPRNDEYSLFSFFLHDEIELIEDSLMLTIGSKFEHNEFTGFEAQPNVRMLFSPDETSSIWASYSRAVRTPSRADDASRAPFGQQQTELGPIPIVLFGNPDIESENLNAFELGFRKQVTPHVSLDLAGFYFDYRELSVLTPQAVAFGPNNSAFIPLVFENVGEAETWGGELLLEVKPIDNWRLQFVYSYFDIHSTSSVPGASIEQASEYAHNKASIRSLLSLGRNWEVDSFLRFMDRIGNFDVDSYVELDLRLAYHFTDNLELAVIGQNLLDDQHREYGDDVVSPSATLIQRGVYGRFTWTF